MNPGITGLRLVASCWLVGALLTGCGCDESAAPVPAPTTTAGQGGGGTGGAGGSEPAPSRLVVQLGADVPTAIAERVVALLGMVTDQPLLNLGPAEGLPPLGPDSRLVGVGDAAAVRALIPPADVSALGSEGFVLRSGTVEGLPALVADGQPLTPDPFGHPSLGDGFAAYALLEQLGFAFLHPLAPTVPAELTWPAATVDRYEAPRWPLRGIHLHTMHPLELTHLLQGWGPAGPDDAAGWQGLLPEWSAFLEWAVANRQNRVTWALLRASSWNDFAESAERRQRLTTLVDLAHQFGVAVGIDAPIVLQQQHAFQLITDQGDLADEIAQLHQRVDYLMATGLDFLKTESGTTEFTAPSDTRMVEWMDELASYLADAYDTRALIKIHCSTGQTAEHYDDPDTGEPLNFNFLPHYADPRLGVLPHTVQHYGLDDPAPTYGNTDFGYIREFLQEEVGRRPVVFYPETAYWVSFDVDVPLFLPVYAERRLSDLRRLASDEDQGLMGRGAHQGERMDGQLFFSSGWEWGYWLNDVVTARAAWDPQTDVADEAAALRSALEPVVRPFGTAGDQVATLLVSAMQMERDLLILGKVGGQSPADVVRRNGQAYLQGVESWDDIADLAESLGLHPTQPDKLGLVEMRNPLHDPPGYSAEVEPLLAEMEARFGDLADDLAALEPTVPAAAAPLLDDLIASARMTALRATQVHGLYDYVDGFWTEPESWRQARLDAARDALDQAAALVAAREAHYRTDPDRIAGWGNNPTAYEFGYLWTVRSLYYWWRDEGKAVEIPISPCYRNIIHPVDVGLGEGLGYDAAGILADLFDTVPGIGSITECLTVPATEPSYGHSLGLLGRADEAPGH